MTTVTDPRIALAFRDRLLVRARDPRLHAIAEEGDVFYVSPDVTAWIKEAQMAFSAEHILCFEPTDLPSQSGLICFDEPPSPLAAWAFVNDGDGVSLGPCHRDDSIRRWRAFSYRFGKPFRQQVDQAFEHAIERGAIPPDDRRVGAVHTIQNVLYVWMQFIKDEIVAVEDAPLDRAERRRAERRGRLSRLRIVHLRRYAQTAPSTHGGESDVEWSRRWTVRGHWRNQPYGPGRTHIRAKYIRPFVKGPPDKPLVVKDHMYAVTR